MVVTRYEVRLAGFGGQGVITLSKMITHAAAIQEGLAVTQTEAYSAAARGGKCWAEVVVDLDKDKRLIDYPKAMEPYDFVVVLSDAAAQDVKKTMFKKADDTGFLIWDDKMIPKFRTARRVKSLALAAQELAIEQFGDAVYGNSILFGAFTSISEIFPEAAGRKTLESFVPPATLETNLKAFALGLEKGRQFRDSLKEGTK